MLFQKLKEITGLEGQISMLISEVFLCVLHCPFTCLSAFLRLFIYSDIKERVQKALGLLFSMFKDVSLFMAVSIE